MTQISPPAPPRIPSGQEIFDAIMGHIEPELTTAGSETVGQTYQNETPEQTAARKQRYELAFERYQQAYEGYIATLDAQVNRYKHDAFRHAELQDRGAEDGLLDQLSASFLQAA